MIGEKLLTVGEVADLTGTSERTVRRWIADAIDPLPVIRVGRTVRIRPSGLEAWLERHTQGRAA